MLLPALLPLLLALQALALPSFLVQPSLPDLSSTNTRVPVLLGVMSKCPDAELCETVWDHVLDRVGGLVDIELVYIGSLNETERYGVHCMHGESECTGNVQQLCARKHWTNDGKLAPWSDWWNFVQCMNYGPTTRIGDHQVAKQCASVVGRDWDAEAHACVAGPEGGHLLRKSIRRAQELGITKSCTVVINGKEVCVHDGRWKDCDGGHEVGDFAEQVRKEWKRLNDA